MVSNIRKVWKKWTRVSRILGREGAYAKLLGVFYKAVMHSVLIFIL